MTHFARGTSKSARSITQALGLRAPPKPRGTVVRCGQAAGGELDRGGVGDRVDGREGAHVAASATMRSARAIACAGSSPCSAAARSATSRSSSSPRRSWRTVSW
jgi:hypothetical protein